MSKLYCTRLLENCARLALSLHKIREISATDQVAILIIERDECKFVKFVGKKTGKFVLESAISRQTKANKFSLVFWLNEIVHINAPLAAVRHNPS